MKTQVAVLSVLLLFVTASESAADEIPPNPYGVAGWGRLSLLGMPADCLDYDWNGLHAGTLCQMCRPNHYYNYIGIPVRWWGYDELTGQINDPVRFAQWVTDNPGRVWIIGNEPDLVSQDGLTREQYAQMYKTYYDFIRPLDPTARFCIGAITGGSTTSALTYTTGWYEYVLDYYKNAYGQPMPIDIWNIHSYCGPAQIEDPDQPIRDFVTPFINWCHTVDNGRYAGCEVWITELPIGEWMGALSEEWIIWFAQRYLPRLERSGINRWFWFVSSDSSEWATVALTKSGVVTPVGQAYSALANGFPNDVIPVSPYVPDPTPPAFSDDFSSGAIPHPWMIRAGKWAVEDGALRQSRVGYPWVGEACVLQYTYGDFNARLRMRVNNASDPNNWAGLLFHAAGRFDHHGQSGYLVFLRRNGAIGLYNRYDGTVQEVAGAVADASQWQNIRVQMAGWRVQVWANGSLIIDRTDANQRFAQGYTIFQVLKTDSSYDDVYVWNAPDVDPAVVGTTISSTRLVADDSIPYSVTITAEDADGVSEIADMRILLDDGTFEADHARACLAWGLTDQDIAYDGGQWQFLGDAAGGGRYALRLDGWGSDAYVTPLSAATSINGNRRSATFTFTVKPAWAPAYGQRLRGRVRDVKAAVTDWVLSPTIYGVYRSTPGDLDYDRDVDQADFGLLQACVKGAGIPQADPACADARLDADDDVDSADVAAFLGCLSGAGVPGQPDCAGN